MSFGIVFPKVVALRMGIGNVSQADAQHLLKERRLPQSGLSEIGPVPTLTTPDHIVNSGQGVLRMSEGSVEHGPQFVVTRALHHTARRAEAQQLLYTITFVLFAARSKRTACGEVKHRSV
ncbi:MAG: hypothetical protein ACREYE_26995 [Gammaproteobacteria bacterium]